MEYYETQPKKAGTAKMKAKTFGERIKARREELGYSVREMGRNLAKSNEEIERLEGLAISLEPLAKALGVSSEFLLGMEDEDCITMGDRIKQCKNFTSVEDIAQKSGWPVKLVDSMVNEYYYDRSMYTSYSALADALYVAPEYLLGQSVQYYPENFPPENPVTTGEKIFNRRYKKGYTRQELADLCNVKKVDIWLYETAKDIKIPEETLERLDKLLDLSAPLQKFDEAAEQEKALYEMATALEHLRKSWIECVDAFSNAYIDCNEYILGEENSLADYPFHDSFDEINVTGWIDGVLERIERKSALKEKL